MTKEDFKLIAGNFSEIDLPKQERWLLNYFKTDIQKNFLIYYLQFQTVDRFSEHTGIKAENHYLKKLEMKYHTLVVMRNQAKSNFDIEKLWKIETGRTRGADIEKYGKNLILE